MQLNRRFRHAQRLAHLRAAPQHVINTGRPLNLFA
jgi:hypothetical protein